jgi:hypothetical protein
LVRWVGVLSVIGQNKLTCDWLDWPVVWGTEKGRSVDLLGVCMSPKKGCSVDLWDVCVRS